jgi:hypothetical protein
LHDAAARTGVSKVLDEAVKACAIHGDSLQRWSCDAQASCHARYDTTSARHVSPVLRIFAED